MALAVPRPAQDAFRVELKEERYDQAHLETRIKRFTRALGESVVVEQSGQGRVRAYGEVIDEASGKRHRWTLVGSPSRSLQAEAVR
jgi:hypothetical protein